MAIINDTDLLLLEPSVFTDAASAGLLLGDANDGVIVGTQFSSSSGEFLKVDIEPGHVVLVDEEPLEIIQATGQTTLSVTRRRDPETLPIAPGDGTGLSYSVVTFRLLIVESEQWLGRMLGLEASHPTQPLTADDVVNYDDFAPLVALRTISQAFARAFALDPESTSLRDRAELYERLEREMRVHLVATIDTNGDGMADEQRRLAVGTWVRV